MSLPFMVLVLPFLVTWQPLQVTCSEVCGSPADGALSSRRLRVPTMERQPNNLKQLAPAPAPAAVQGNVAEATPALAEEAAPAPAEEAAPALAAQAAPALAMAPAEAPITELAVANRPRRSTAWVAP